MKSFIIFVTGIPSGGEGDHHEAPVPVNKRDSSMKKRLYNFTALLLAAIAITLSSGSCNREQYDRIDDGLVVRLDAASDYPGQAIRLKVINDQIIRVTAIPRGEFPGRPGLMAVTPSGHRPEFTIEKADGYLTLSTPRISAEVSLKTGRIAFTASDGTPLLTEQEEGGRIFSPVMAAGETGYTIRQQWEGEPDEALYGLGANQASLMNLRGKDADLFQYNTVSAVPFLLSNRNYGILWDNYSRTRYGDIREWDDLSSLALWDRDGQEGGLTTLYRSRRGRKEIITGRIETEISYQFIPDLAKLPEGFDLAEGLVTWEGEIGSEIAGMHKFMFTAAGYGRLWIDGELLYDRWRQCWNASAGFYTLMMEQGKRYPLKIEWIPDGGESFIALRHLTPADEEEQQHISLWSEVADQIDYYFISGESPDEVISGYRTVTGKAPLMPRWAMGFWQSRQRYTTQEELLEVAREYRRREIPFDNIVLDWQYWPIDRWGDHQFDPDRFPDPEGMIRTLHQELNARLMISVWPKYYTSTGNYNYMNERGWLYQRNVREGRKDWIGYLSTFYDAFNADARKAFWEQIDSSLYAKGVDAWWLDATEPDITSNLPMDERKAMMNPTALGSADRYFNAYPLVQAQGVWEGQRESDPEKRVFILTRAAFAGLQRYAAANWSGDIAATWHDMAAQIPCGVNLSMSGIPWWTMDIGGFSVESRYHNPLPEDLAEWRELMTRWHQFGTFVPIFRSHGEYPYREIYNTAPKGHPAYETMVEYNRLRYRLMPYIYTLAGEVWRRDYTIMRGLIMDFGLDTALFNIADQYMFGPSLMVCPVTSYRARSRSVYLPAPHGWYDLHTGHYHAGGEVIEADAPYEWMPLFAREGSIIPTGPAQVNTAATVADPLTIWIYAGHDASFELYEDDGLSNDYEKGEWSVIPFVWHEAEGTVTIGRREGSWQGMPAERNINMIKVTKRRPVRLSFDRKADRTVVYTGEEITVDLR